MNEFIEIVSAAYPSWKEHIIEVDVDGHQFNAPLSFWDESLKTWVKAETRRYKAASFLIFNDRVCFSFYSKTNSVWFQKNWKEFQSEQNCLGNTIMIFANFDPFQLVAMKHPTTDRWMEIVSEIDAEPIRRIAKRMKGLLFENHGPRAGRQ